MAENDALRRIAERIANEHLQDAEYAIVYEDEDCGDLTEQEWQQIHRLITRSRAVLDEADDGQDNTCPHASASGVDTTPVGPGKVWRCDHCGLRWTDEVTQ